jgi:E3 ubiquitin-protein ligase TRIP12
MEDDLGHSDDNDEEHSEDDEDQDDGEGDGADAVRMSALDRFTQLAAQSGMNLDDATTAAIFGNEFRGLGSLMSGLNSRFKRLRSDLRSNSVQTRLAALRDCSEVLLVSNEDTLGGAFSASSFATEFIAILNGKPNIEASSRAPPVEQNEDVDMEMDEDAMLARALAMSTEGEMPMGMGVENDEMECQLLACRCLAHLMEALPGSGHTLVHLGAVPVLCSKLNEPSYIELAEQTLSVSAEGGVGLMCRRWKKCRPSTPPPSSARAVSRRC